MDSNNSSNVAVGKPKTGGAVFVAPKATAAPTDASTALASAFANVGYCSEDGLTNSVTTGSTSIKAWGGDQVANVQTDRTETFKFSMIETNENALKQVYGSDNVTNTSGALKVIHNSELKESQMWVFEILLSSERIKRIVVPLGKITSVDDIVYKDGEVIKYGVTISALPDTLGNTAYEYIAEVAKG